MRFEPLLASRYIFTQKRHSLLTIISITLALALMTSIFTGYYTLTCVMREVNYANQPYHLRIYDITEEQAESLKGYDHVESVEFKSFIAGNTRTDLMLQKGMKDSFTWFQRILRDKELGFEVVDYERYDFNRSLINYDLIDEAAIGERLVYFCLLFVFVIFLAMSMRMIIDTAFEVSSKERERQFGMLQTIGASPGQIVRIITLEGLMLCVAGVPLGLIIGIGASWLAFKTVMSSGIAEAYIAPALAQRLVTFHISPLYLAISAVTGLMWVLFSAYGTGMRVIKISPVEAIKNGSTTVKKVRRRSILGLIFGWQGKLASRNSRRQPKRFIITALSLTLSLTLYAGVSVVIEDAYETTKAIVFMETGGMEGEIELYDNCEIDDVLGYRDIVENLRNTGYFDSIRLNCYALGALKDIDSVDHNIIYYVNKDEYESELKISGIEPPMSYEELEASGGVIVTYYNIPVQDLTEGTLNCVGRFLSEDDIKEIKKNSNENDSLLEIYKKSEKRTTEKKVKIVANLQVSNDIYYLHDEDVSAVCVYAPISMYENGDYELYGNISSSFEITVSIKDTEYYQDAIKYIENPKSKVKLLFDSYEVYNALDAVYTGLRLGTVFLSIFIALIAIVNLVNIITTGLVNRKSEIAAMQCVGMTEGQLYTSSAIECLQFVLTSIVSSIILCALLVLATKKFMEISGVLEMEGVNELSINYFAAVPKILIGAAAALGVSIISSFITLRRMQKTEPVERLRSVD